MDIVPFDSVCSSFVGSKITVVVVDVAVGGKKAKVKHNGVWWIDKGTGDLSRGECCFSSVYCISV